MLAFRWHWLHRSFNGGFFVELCGRFQQREAQPGQDQGSCIPTPRNWPLPPDGFHPGFFVHSWNDSNKILIPLKWEFKIINSNRTSLDPTNRHWQCITTQEVLTNALLQRPKVGKQKQQKSKNYNENIYYPIPRWQQYTMSRIKPTSSASPAIAIATITPTIHYESMWNKNYTMEWLNTHSRITEMFRRRYLKQTACAFGKRGKKYLFWNRTFAPIWSWFRDQK